MRQFRIALSMFAIGTLSLAALAQDKPAEPATLTQPGSPDGGKSASKPSIYNEKADAKADIAAAVARAAKENKRVLVQWGANWCGWCHRLHDTLKADRELAKVMQYEYERVLVDVGQFDKNMELAGEYGADLKTAGLPFVTILDASGKAIANQETGALEAGKGYDLDKVASFLKSHQAPAVKADDVLAKGVAEAKSSGRRVLLHFGAPWCGWCHRLEDWMARPEVGAILVKDFVDVKIDTDRATGGKEMLTRFRGSEKGGIPWFVILDAASGAEPKAIITSDAPKTGNIGFPAQPEEIEHFIEMMKKAAAKMTPADIETLRKTLAEKPKAGEDNRPATAPMETIRPAGK